MIRKSTLLPRPMTLVRIRMLKTEAKRTRKIISLRNWAATLVRITVLKTEQKGTHKIITLRNRVTLVLTWMLKTEVWKLTEK
ncbi:hypothetical protein COOONC_03583 [Cooperia oncophora]